MIRPRNRRLLVLRAIASHVERHGYAPNLQEIGRGCGLASTASVVYQLRRLAGMGLIEYRPRCPRAVRVLLTPGLETVPVVRCEPCGMDMPADHACRSAEVVLRDHP